MSPTAGLGTCRRPFLSEKESFLFCFQLTLCLPLCNRFFTFGSFFLTSFFCFVLFPCILFAGVFEKGRRNDLVVIKQQTNKQTRHGPSSPSGVSHRKICIYNTRRWLEAGESWSLVMWPSGVNTDVTNHDLCDLEVLQRFLPEQILV